MQSWAIPRPSSTGPVSAQSTQKSTHKYPATLQTSLNATKWHILQIMAETWIQSYARASVLQVLKRLKHGRLTITITYQDKEVVETFGSDSADESETVSLEINSTNVWGRFAQAFALVSAVVFTPGSMLTFLSRGLPKHIWCRRSTAITCSGCSS